MRLLYQLFVALSRMKAGTVYYRASQLLSKDLVKFFTEAGVEQTEPGVYSQSRQSEAGESGNFNISGGGGAVTSTHILTTYYLVCVQRLKHQTPRQVDLNFEELIDKFRDRQRLYEEGVMRDRQQQAEK